MFNAERADAPSVEDIADARLGVFVETHYARLLRLARLISVTRRMLRTRSRSGWSRHGGSGPVFATTIGCVAGSIGSSREAMRVARGRRGWFDRLFPQGDVEWLETPAHAADLTQRLALKTAFAHLSPEQRAVVALHLHLGYSIADTASMVGAPIETVRSRMRLARARLRQELSEDER